VQSQRWVGRPSEVKRAPLKLREVVPELVAVAELGIAGVDVWKQRQ
jgi:hypothetical protein